MSHVIRQALVSELIPLRMRVLRPGRPEAEARWPGDDAAQHWLLQEEGGADALAVLSLFPAMMPGGGPDIQLRGMAVEPTRQGQGLGRALLLVVQAQATRSMWCNARVSALGFYTRLGWKVVSEEFPLPGIGPHRRMLWHPA